MAQRKRPVKRAAKTRRQGPSVDHRSRLALLQDLQVHQEEILVQNQQLIAAQAALEETRDRFIALYDFAPNGYLTLDDHGIVLEINLTAALLFGKPRHAIIGMPLRGFVEKAHRGYFLDYMRRCRNHQSGPGPSVEFTIRTLEGLREVQLLCGPRRADGASRREFFTALLDITERKRLEAEREAATRAQAELVGRMISVQEDERRRIARDLHDHLGQQLTGLRLKLELVAQSRSGAETQQRVSEAQKVAEQLDRHLDFFTAELRPSALDDLGLASALRQLVREWSENFGIGVEFHTDGSGERLDRDVETHLYRIAQEALNNVYKHAGARRVGVLLERRNDRLVLIIEDDGAGFHLDQPLNGDHRSLGLLGMQERAALIGGRMEIETVPGHGTTVFLQLPSPQVEDVDVSPAGADPEEEFQTPQRSLGTRRRRWAGPPHRRALG
jgi:PAS domain S-box-containing protein